MKYIRCENMRILYDDKITPVIQLSRSVKDVSRKRHSATTQDDRRQT